MRPFTTHTGRMVPLDRDDVDTDQIIPAQHCRRLTKTGFEHGLFAGWRAGGGFVLDRPERAGATVLVAAANFGTGSSRETAVWALANWGFRAVVAESFGDIFQRNAYRNGLLPVQLERAEAAALRAGTRTDPATTVTIDLEQRRISWRGGEHRFPIGDRDRELLLAGLDEIDVVLRDGERIARYERQRRPWLPVLPVPGHG